MDLWDPQRVEIISPLSAPPFPWSLYHLPLDNLICVIIYNWKQFRLCFHQWYFNPVKKLLIPGSHSQIFSWFRVMTRKPFFLKSSWVILMHGWDWEPQSRMPYVMDLGKTSFAWEVRWFIGICVYIINCCMVTCFKEILEFPKCVGTHLALLHCSCGTLGKWSIWKSRSKISPLVEIVRELQNLPWTSQEEADNGELDSIQTAEKSPFSWYWE